MDDSKDSLDQKDQPEEKKTWTTPEFSRLKVSSTAGGPTSPAPESITSKPSS